MEKGLSTEEARIRLKEQGYNELESSKKKNILFIAFETIKEPMFLLLISCGLLYMLLGNYHEGIILLSTILIIIFITFYQHQKTEKALDALKKLSSPRVLVIRDGKEQRIPGRELVPGDLVILNEGDRVGGDGKLIHAQNLNIDESLLTGESLPVNKQPFTGENEAEGRVYSSTLVTQGKGLALISETGKNTQFGKIGTSLQSIEQQPTRLQKEMKVLIRTLFIIGLCLSITVVLAFYFSTGNFLQSLLNGLAAAMAILPEEFPVVLTVFLALGAWRLSKKNVLTRNPSAIETLGSATVLCSDKTGTITQNKMEVVALYDGTDLISAKDFSVHPDKVSVLLKTASFASNKDSIDPMEKAIHSAYQKFKSASAGTDIFVKEYPLSKELLAMSIVTDNNNGAFLVSTKGAPEAIFGLCQLSEEEKNREMVMVNTLAEKGYRLLGLASSVFTKETLPEKQTDFQFNFLGLLALEDPIRKEVPEAIQQCKDAGIRVIMITGDFPATAKSIGEQIGLPKEGLVVSGEDVKNKSDEELDKVIASVSIFARVAPEQKLRIVKALKRNGEIVAMTGDGVNDAPALKAADIGVAMGKKGTDVAREASSLVLLDDNFASIVSAIRSGRRIFDNLQKAMSYILAIHVPIVGLTLLPAFFSAIPLLLMALHIVFMELLIDPACSIAFEYEQEEKNIMKRKPRDPEEKFFGGKKILASVLKGVLLLAMVLIVYFLSFREGHSEGEARAITFSALIIGNLALILTSLSKSRSFFAVFTERNYAVLIILAIAISVLVLVISVPGLQHIFAFEFPGYSHFITSFIGAAVMLLVLELIKLMNQKKAEALTD